MQVKDLKICAFIIEGKFREPRRRTPFMDLPEENRNSKSLFF
jgi:hypothetical protein